jgi:beta-lactamase class A
MAMPMPAVLPVARRAAPAPMKRVHASTARANAGVRYITGMDGVRRPVAMTPRAVLQNLQAPVFTDTPVFTEELVDEVHVGGIHWPAVRIPGFAWPKPAIAFGLVATALVASTVTVRAIATPQTITARAETAAAAQTAAPAPSPVASVAPAVAPAAQKTGLQTILDNFAAGNLDKFGIVVKDLKTGQTASLNANHQITSASLYKLFVAQRIYQRIDLGQIDYSTAAGGGTGRNVEGCLRIMINISDNACGRALGAILGWGNQDPALRLEGYKETSLRTPQQTSAEDVALLFERLYNGTLVSPSSSQRFMDLLKDQRVNNRLPQGLPGGTIIAHKTGDLDGVVHDAGIVYGPKTNYLVVVTSGPWNLPGNAPAMFADLSRQLWNYFEQ